MLMPNPFSQALCIFKSHNAMPYALNKVNIFQPQFQSTQWKERKKKSH